MIHSYIFMTYSCVDMTRSCIDVLLTSGPRHPKARNVVYQGCNAAEYGAPRACVLQCVAVYCSVLQCVAVCCSVLQCVAVCCSVLRCVALSCGTAQWNAVGCSGGRFVETRRCRNMVRYGHVCCSVLHLSEDAWICDKNEI